MSENKKNYEIIEKNGVTMLAVSAVNNTGVAEAYCTIRCSDGGVSKSECGPFSTNLYKPLGREDGVEDFKTFSSALGVDYRTVITNRLTAGTNKVRFVDEKSLDGYDIFDEPNAPRADGLITNSNKITLYNYAADCAIIHFVDIENRAVGSCHAGWAGSLNGIIPNTVSAMKEKFGTEAEKLIAVICPGIAECCFEVSDDVANKFVGAGYEEYVSRQYGEKPHVDLFGVNRAVLKECGLKDENIISIQICTCCNEKMFHSYRRGPVSENGLHMNGMNGMFIKLK